MHPTMTVTPVPASASQSPRLTLPSLSPLNLDDGLIHQHHHVAGNDGADTEPADRPLARTPRRLINRMHGSRPDFDTNAEMAAIARLSLALDSATASSLSLALSSSLPPPVGSSSSLSASSAAAAVAVAAAPAHVHHGLSTPTGPNHARHPTSRQQRPLSIVNTLPPPTLPTLGPPRTPSAAASTPRPSLPPHDPLSPLRMFTGHDDTSALSDTDTLSRDERRAAHDPAPPYLDPTAHFYPELDAFGNVRVTVPILPDLETRQAVVKMIQMHYVPPLASSSSNAANPQQHQQQHHQQGLAVPPGALQHGAGDWVLFGHASASSLCYVYRQGAHVVTIALIPTAPDSSTTSSPFPDQLIIPLSPRSPTHHTRLLNHTLTRRPSSSVGHTIHVYHAIDKRILPLSPAELAAAADVLTFVQRRAHYRSSAPKRRPSSASIRSTRSFIHVPLHAPPKYYDLSLHRAAAGSPPPFESLSRRTSSVRRLSVSRREAAAGDPRAVMRRTLSRRESGRIAAAVAPDEPSTQESDLHAMVPPVAVAAVVGPAAGKRKLGSGFMKRWSRVVGGGSSSSSSKHHYTTPPSPPLYSSPDAPAVPPRPSHTFSPVPSLAALGTPSSRRSSASSAASDQSSPALNAVRSLASVAESPVPAPASTAGSPLQCHAQLAAPVPPPVPPKDNHHQHHASSASGHRLSMSPSMLFKKVKAALPSASKVD